MRAGRVTAYLFAYGRSLRAASPGRAALYAGGKGPQGEAMKVLWFARGDTVRRLLLVEAVRMDGEGAFDETFSAVGVAGASGGTYYASIVDIPSAGCWRLVVRSGPARGRFVVRALAG